MIRKKKQPILGKGAFSLIVFFSVLISGFYYWQYQLHQELTTEVAACYGGKYIYNSCQFGSGCHNVKPGYSRNLKGWDPFFIPTGRDTAVHNIVREGQGAVLDDHGYCLPWTDNFLQNTELSPAAEIPESISSFYK